MRQAITDLDAAIEKNDAQLLGEAIAEASKAGVPTFRLNKAKAQLEKLASQPPIAPEPAAPQPVAQVTAAATPAARAPSPPKAPAFDASLVDGPPPSAKPVLASWANADRGPLSKAPPASTAKSSTAPPPPGPAATAAPGAAAGSGNSLKLPVDSKVPSPTTPAQSPSNAAGAGAQMMGTPAKASPAPGSREQKVAAKAGIDAAVKSRDVPTLKRAVDYAKEVGLEKFKMRPGEVLLDQLWPGFVEEAAAKVKSAVEEGGALETLKAAVQLADMCDLECWSLQESIASLESELEPPKPAEETAQETVAEPPPPQEHPKEPALESVAAPEQPKPAPVPKQEPLAPPPQEPAQEKVAEPPAQPEQPKPSLQEPAPVPTQEPLAPPPQEPVQEKVAEPPAQPEQPKPSLQEPAPAPKQEHLTPPPPAPVDDDCDDDGVPPMSMMRSAKGEKDFKFIGEILEKAQKADGVHFDEMPNEEESAPPSSGGELEEMEDVLDDDSAADEPPEPVADPARMPSESSSTTTIRVDSRRRKWHRDLLHAAMQDLSIYKIGALAAALQGAKAAKVEKPLLAKALQALNDLIRRHNRMKQFVERIQEMDRRGELYEMGDEQLQQIVAEAEECDAMQELEAFLSQG